MVGEPLTWQWFNTLLEDTPAKQMLGGSTEASQWITNTKCVFLWSSHPVTDPSWSGDLLWGNAVFLQSNSVPKDFPRQPGSRAFSGTTHKLFSNQRLKGRADLANLTFCFLSKTKHKPMSNFIYLICPSTQDLVADVMSHLSPSCSQKLLQPSQILSASSS